MARWKPENEEIYFSVDTILREVCCYTWVDEEVDNGLYNMGNVFETEIEAENALEKVQELLLSLQGD